MSFDAHAHVTFNSNVTILSSLDVQNTSSSEHIASKQVVTDASSSIDSRLTALEAGVQTLAPALTATLQNLATSYDGVQSSVTAVEQSGENGVIGPVGPTGPAGATGPTPNFAVVSVGATGPTGPTGPIGLPGADGDAGPPGEQGVPGPHGVKGATGPVGDVGEPGVFSGVLDQSLVPTVTETYDIGVAPVYTLNGVEVAPNEPGALLTTAPVYINTVFSLHTDVMVNSVYIGAAKISGNPATGGVTLPVGSTAGGTSVAGAGLRIAAFGDGSITSPPASNVSPNPPSRLSEDGKYGKGDTILLGDTGYLCTAVNGTALTWVSLGLLRGSQGGEGIMGEPGERGDTGDVGENGDAGDAGEPGAPGPPGATGPQGLPGADGPRGNRGVRGDRGQKGLTGLTGPPGEEGPAGLAGVSGETWRLVQTDLVAGADAVVLCQMPLPANSTGVYEATVVARDAADDASCSFVVSGVFSCNNGRTVSSTPYMLNPIVQFNADAGITASFTSSDSDLTLDPQIQFTATNARTDGSTWKFVASLRALLVVPDPIYPEMVREGEELLRGGLGLQSHGGAYTCKLLPHGNLEVRAAATNALMWSLPNIQRVTVTGGNVVITRLDNTELYRTAYAAVAGSNYLGLDSNGELTLNVSNNPALINPASVLPENCYVSGNDTTLWKSSAAWIPTQALRVGDVLTSLDASTALRFTGTQVVVSSVNSGVVYWTSSPLASPAASSIVLETLLSHYSLPVTSWLAVKPRSVQVHAPQQHDAGSWVWRAGFTDKLVNGDTLRDVNLTPAGNDAVVLSIHPAGYLSLQSGSVVHWTTERSDASTRAAGDTPGEWIVTSAQFTGGNLVATNSSGVVVFTTGATDSAASLSVATFTDSLVGQPRFYLSLESPSNAFLWRSNTQLYPGHVFHNSQMLLSLDSISALYYNQARAAVVLVIMSTGQELASFAAPHGGRLVLNTYTTATSTQDTLLYADANDNIAWNSQNLSALGFATLEQSSTTNAMPPFNATRRAVLQAGVFQTLADTAAVYTLGKEYVTTFTAAHNMATACIVSPNKQFIFELAGGVLRVRQAASGVITWTSYSPSTATDARYITSASINSAVGRFTGTNSAGEVAFSSVFDVASIRVTDEGVVQFLNPEKQLISVLHWGLYTHQRVSVNLPLYSNDKTSSLTLVMGNSNVVQFQLKTNGAIVWQSTSFTTTVPPDFVYFTLTPERKLEIRSLRAANTLIGTVDLGFTVSNVVGVMEVATISNYAQLCFIPYSSDPSSSTPESWTQKVYVSRWVNGTALNNVIITGMGDSTQKLGGTGAALRTIRYFMMLHAGNLVIIDSIDDNKTVWSTPTDGSATQGIALALMSNGAIMGYNREFTKVFTTQRSDMPQYAYLTVDDGIPLLHPLAGFTFDLRQCFYPGNKLPRGYTFGPYLSFDTDGTLYFGNGSLQLPGDYAVMSINTAGEIVFKNAAENVTLANTTNTRVSGPDPGTPTRWLYVGLNETFVVDMDGNYVAYFRKDVSRNTSVPVARLLSTSGTTLSAAASSVFKKLQFAADMIGVSTLFVIQNFLSPVDIFLTITSTIINAIDPTLYVPILSGNQAGSLGAVTDITPLEFISVAKEWSAGNLSSDAGVLFNLNSYTGVSDWNLTELVGIQSRVQKVLDGRTWGEYASSVDASSIISQLIFSRTVRTLSAS